MAKRYAYNRMNTVAKGLVTLASLAYFVTLVAFIAFLAINYVPSLNSIIDFTELSYVVGKVFLKLEAFLIIGAVISIIGFIFSVTMINTLSKGKGGFKGLILFLFGVALVVFFVIITIKDLTLSYILNYCFGGILVVGIFSILLGGFAIYLRSKERRRIERKLRKFERNYMKFEKYNR